MLYSILDAVDGLLFGHHHHHWHHWHGCWW
jgi:hypothetical protein